MMFSAAGEAIAGDMRKTVVACLEARKGSVMSAVCGMQMDPEKQKVLIEGLRSTPAFLELVDALKPQLDLTKKKLFFLYPGAGNHIAPLYMAANILSSSQVSEIEFVYTDIDGCKLLELIDNLRLLSQVDADFMFCEDDTVGSSCDGKGEKKTFTLLHKGKIIKIQYQLRCSDKNKWFRDEDYKNADGLIQHDSAGEAISQILFMTYQYLEAKSRNSGRKPLIMEDTTRMDSDSYFGKEKPEYGRRFDLELLGDFTRSKSRYSHRKRVETRLAQFSEIQACHARNDILETGGGYGLDKYTVEDVSRWIAARKAPEKYMSMFPEIGYAAFEHGVALNVHSLLFEMDPRALQIIMETSLAANNGAFYLQGIMGYFYERIHQGPENKGERLFSLQFYADLIEHAPEILRQLQKIKPQLAQGFAIRILQVVIKFFDDLPEFIDKNHKENPSEGYKAVGRFIAIVTAFLGHSESRCRKQLLHISALLKDMNQYHPQWVISQQLSAQAQSVESYEAARRAFIEWNSNLRGKDDKILNRSGRFLKKHGDQVFESIS